jgi:hypothetical protein
LDVDLIGLINYDTFLPQCEGMLISATRVTGCQATLFIDHSMPWECRVTEVGNAANDTSRASTPTQSRNLTIGHYASIWYLYNNRLNALPKFTVRLIFHM